MKNPHNIKTFKPYQQNQPMLLPPSLDEMIPEGHMVRVVHGFVESIDISMLIATYKGGGTSSYHPRMMLKVLVYAYANKIYSSRRVTAQNVRGNINFMWLSGGEAATDFRHPPIVSEQQGCLSTLQEVD
jgi:transposase